MLAYWVVRLFQEIRVYEKWEVVGVDVVVNIGCKYLLLSINYLHLRPDYNSNYDNNRYRCNTKSKRKATNYVWVVKKNTQITEDKEKINTKIPAE